MVNYNTTEYTHEDGTKYVFVTRGKSAEFTAEEITKYINDTLGGVKHEEAKDNRLAAVMEDADTPGKQTLLVPNARQNIFLADLKRGISFCKSKYAVDEAAIIAEATRIFPSLNLLKLWEKKEIRNDGVAGQAKRP